MVGCQQSPPLPPLSCIKYLCIGVSIGLLLSTRSPGEETAISNGTAASRAAARCDGEQLIFVPPPRERRRGAFDAAKVLSAAATFRRCGLVAIPTAVPTEAAAAVRLHAHRMVARAAGEAPRTAVLQRAGRRGEPRQNPPAGGAVTLRVRRARGPCVAPVACPPRKFTEKL